MLFFVAHDDPHELQNARFAVLFTCAQTQTTRPAPKTDRALVQSIEVWQWSGFLGAFVTVFSNVVSLVQVRPIGESTAYFLRPLPRTFAACDSFDSRVRGFPKVLPASLNCFFVGFPAISSSVTSPRLTRLRVHLVRIPDSARAD
jgi:hypothetical protein